MKSEPNVCDCCGYEKEDLHLNTLIQIYSGFKPSETQQVEEEVCDICYSSMAGVAEAYPNNHMAREHGVILKMIAYSTNLILDAIKDSK